MSVIADLSLQLLFPASDRHLYHCRPAELDRALRLPCHRVAVSELSARARRGARSAVERRQELERLYAFSQLLLSSDNPAELLNLIPRYIVESFGIRSAAVSLSSRSDIYRSGPTIDGLESQRSAIDLPARRTALRRRPSTGLYALRMGMRVVGCMGVSGSTLSRQTLEAIGSLVAIAIERAARVEKLSRAEAARESEQLRSVLLDSVTHEFRSPLTAIKASVTSLLGSSSPEVILPRRNRNC
jgi:two-component system, OmpR family, sensor histidine kinase KdpD